MAAVREGWERTTLGEVAETQLGKTLPRGEGASEAGFPYLRNVNLQWGNIDTTNLNRMMFTRVEQAKYRIRRGDLLVCEGGEVGRCAVVKSDMDGIFFQNAIHRVRVDQVRSSGPYLALWIEQLTRSGVVAQFATQQTISHLSQSRLRALPVLLPPLSEQQRIVDLTDSIDAVINRAQAEVDALDSARTRLRDEYPNQCPTVPISQVLHSIVSGTSTKFVDGDGDSVNLLTLAAIRPGAFYAEEIKSVGAAQLPEKSKLVDGDLLITRSNTPQRVGYVALARDVPPQTYIPDLVWKLVPDTAQVSPEYLAEVLSSPTYRRLITASASGTSESMRKINKANFGRLQIPLASLSEQESYLLPLSALGDAQRAAQSALDRLRDLRSSLLSVLLSGEHEIPESYDQFLDLSEAVRAG